jgi:hypothetical protein
MAKKISDEAVKKSTGRIWKEWFSVLNKAGARKMEHKEVAKLLHTKYGLSEWWSQMVTVQYEQDVKGRKKHEKPDGYQISKSKTLQFSASKVFSVIQYPSLRKSWLKDHDFAITKSTKNKSIRGKWADKKTNIEFQFYPKDKIKTQLVIQHSKISSEKEAEKLKKYWERNLNDLKNFLEKI